MLVVRDGRDTLSRSINHYNLGMHPFLEWLMVRAALVLGIAGLIVLSLFLVGVFDGHKCATTLCCEDCSIISVSRVIDGDTFVSPGGRVRLYGVDTPEVGEPCSADATARLSQLAGAAVRMESGPRLRDRYDRLLHYVYTMEGESIDERLIRDGLGWAWRRDGQHRDILVALEEEARSVGRGCLW